MRANQAVMQIHRRRLIHGAAASAAALAALTLLVTLLVGSVRPALAQLSLIHISEPTRPY